MILPPLQGNVQQEDFFIFTACDTHYFDNFGKILINSVLKNTNLGIHVHIFDPSEENIEFCQKKDRVSVSYEHIPKTMFLDAAERWKVEPLSEPEHTRYRRIQTAMQKGNDPNIVNRIQKTYYACARFIRLESLTKPGDKFFAMDVDAVVRKDLPVLPVGKDCYLHKITGKKARVLAGGLYTDGNINGREFLKDYSDLLISNISQDYLYWSIDQDVLDIVVPKYNIGDLPMTLIDWEMNPESSVWTAKGLRKDSEVFISEQKKYIS
jgi:hypothetical protein